jgi:hypothetical protein
VFGLSRRRKEIFFGPLPRGFWLGLGVGSVSFLRWREFGGSQWPSSG